jgi:hypothetical protein
LAVDGNRSGDFYNTNESVTHTNRGNDQWWRVDLQDTYDISDIDVYNRTDCCSDRLRGAKLYVGNVASNDPADFTEVGTLSGGTVPDRFAGISIAGRYVMIRQPRNTYLHIAEVEVFGTRASGLTTLKADVSFEDEESQLEVKVYPNPAKNNIFINLKEKVDGENLVLTLFNAAGRAVIIKDLGYDYGIIERLDLDTLPTGSYYLQISRGSKTETKTIIISK